MHNRLPKCRKLDAFRPDDKEVRLGRLLLRSEVVVSGAESSLVSGVGLNGLSSNGVGVLGDVWLVMAIDTIDAMRVKPG